MEQDIRWQLRFSNFEKALHKLSQSIDFIRNHFEQYADSKDKNEPDFILNEMVKEGMIQRFEYTHELAWNVMKDYATYQGNTNVGGSRDATREAFQLQLIRDGDTWMDMIGSRNKTSHTYNTDTAEEIYTKIIDKYYSAFLDFHRVMKDKLNNDQKK